jgi:transposase
MSQKELGTLVLLKGAVDGVYTVRDVAKRLHLSERRVKQLKRAYREQGDGAVIHGNSGRHPANYKPEALREKIVSLKKNKDYQDTNFTYFRELLAEREGIAVSYSTLAAILKTAGITSKKKHRTEGRRFRRRKRRDAFGEMLQADGSSFDWFGIGERCTLHGFIDDATGDITGLYFCKNECLMGYLEVSRQTFTTYGIPLELYADKAGIFFVNNKKEANWTVEEMLAGHPLTKTQFGEIVENRLGIKLTSAHTPQAKGRIERLWGTLQDRLPTWLRLHNVKTMEEANQRIGEIISWYNDLFGVAPGSEENAFIPLSPNDDLDKLLAVRYERTTDNCGCFSFQNFLFQVESPKPFAKKKLVFLFSEKIGFQVYHEKSYYPAKLIGFGKGRTKTHLPDVVKTLILKNFYADGHTNPAAA